MRESRPPLTPGVYRVQDAARTAADLQDSGWDARRLVAGRSRAEAFAALAAALELPSWFGANLDALWDCLADLEGPTALVVEGWDGFASAAPADAERLLDLLAERTRSRPAFAVALAG